MAETAIWDQYWHFDRIASCFDDAGARNYHDCIAAGWRDFFEKLPGEAAILDLCTGNGAVAIMAAEASAELGKGFRITAVDQAAIDPRAWLTRHQSALAAIDFQAGIAVEALPFPAQSFGAVISQYGIEYSDLQRSLAEVARVVAPGGRVRLVVHAAEGSPAAVAKRVLAEADFALREIDLPGVARDCFIVVTTYERTPNAPPAQRLAARERVAAFEQALRAIGESLPTAADPTMLRNAAATLLDAFNRRGDLDQRALIAIADKARFEIEAHRGRLQALIEAAMTREERAALAARLRELGAREAKESDLVHETILIGHVVEARF